MDAAAVGFAYFALFIVGLVAIGIGYTERVRWLAHSGTAIMAILVFKLLLIVILN